MLFGVEIFDVSVLMRALFVRGSYLDVKLIFLMMNGLNLRNVEKFNFKL